MKPLEEITTPTGLMNNWDQIPLQIELKFYCNQCNHWLQLLSLIRWIPRNARPQAVGNRRDYRND